MKRRAEALEVIALAQKLEPDDAETAFVKGIALLAKKKTRAQAVESLEKAVGLDPLLAEARAMLALALHKSKKADEAREQLEQALDIDPYLVKLEWVAKLEKKLGP
jgi:Flp pilus assembly protein TadD